MPVYESDPNVLPDSEFEPGAIHHLAGGNEGRLLDPRRTPVTIVELRPATGMFVVRIDKFEDRGALWEVPFEEVSHYQFARGARRAADVETIREAIARFDRPLQIPRNLEALPATLARIRASPGALGDLSDMDIAFTRQFGSNPCSGELVKGHRIVLAELGLVAYDGTVVRDRELFAGAWSRERRAEHIVRRMAFVQSFFRRRGEERVCLYRGMSLRGGLSAPRNHGFVSATFSFDVARSHLEASAMGVLFRQLVPVERLFMTVHETPQLGERFGEMEAILFYDEDNPLF